MWYVVRLSSFTDDPDLAEWVGVCVSGLVVVDN